MRQQVDALTLELADNARRGLRGPFVVLTDGPDDGDGLVCVSTEDAVNFEVDYRVPEVGYTGVGADGRPMSE